MIKCPDCDYPNPDDREDCFKCGAKLVPDPIAQPDPPADPAAAAAQPDLTLQMPAPTLQMPAQPAVTQQAQAPPQPPVAPQVMPPVASNVDRFCPQCGASVGNANFCTKCGCATLALPGGDQRSNAIASLVMGIIAIFTCLIPLISVPLGAVGLIVGMRATKSVHRVMAIFGMILSIMALVIAVFWLSCVANIIGSKYD